MDNDDELCVFCLLSHAASTGELDTVKELIRDGADPSSAHECNDALYRATRGSHFEVVRILLEHGADPNGVDSIYHQTPLELALSKYSLELVCVLKRFGGDLSSLSMLDTVRSGDECFVMEMLRIGVPSTEIDDKTGRTLLHEAAIHGYSSMARALVEHGVHIDAKDRWQNEAIDLAKTNYHFELAEYLYGIAKRNLENGS